jgi:hypothetical protein
VCEQSKPRTQVKILMAGGQGTAPDCGCYHDIVSIAACVFGLIGGCGGSTIDYSRVKPPKVHAEFTPIKIEYLKPAGKELLETLAVVAARR